MYMWMYIGQKERIIFLFDKHKIVIVIGEHSKPPSGLNGAGCLYIHVYGTTDRIPYIST